MARGIVVVAQNNETDNYVDQAVVLALSLKAANSETPVSIITNDQIEEADKAVFDQVIEIPWGDKAADTDWKIENRWKVFHVSPYDETIVLDTDMIALDNIDHWWEFLKNYDLYFTTNVLTYRNEKVSSGYYRDAFLNNNLPNIYTGMYYFKKTKFTHHFFSYLEIVMQYWEEFYDLFVPESKPKHMSVDVCAAITCKLLDYTNKVTNPNILTPSFVHMKSKVQNWKNSRNNWIDTINPYMDEQCELKIGNFRQTGLFHYTESKFLEHTKAKEKYRRLLNVE